ncbi:hypothetical protein chiPu_0009809 [Chiloscyllium punctatum]|uniref:Uncharacterized protein n=1 Tax=Chiloscyllium punctatum TaxID=137246 RepID=A0A401SLT2_CHIPU|nr:hypothetical protein [Chiloscyllium punctatum]
MDPIIKPSVKATGRYESEGAVFISARFQAGEGGQNACGMGKRIERDEKRGLNVDIMAATAEAKWPRFHRDRAGTINEAPHSLHCSSRTVYRVTPGASVRRRRPLFKKRDVEAAIKHQASAPNRRVEGRRRVRPPQSSVFISF